MTSTCRLTETRYEGTHEMGMGASHQYSQRQLFGGLKMDQHRDRRGSGDVTHRASSVQLSPHGLVQLIPKVLAMQVGHHGDARGVERIQRMSYLGHRVVHVGYGQRCKKSEFARVRLGDICAILIYLRRRQGCVF